MNPVVSICMPAYKADRYIEEALISIRDQTHRDWELIVVEDGSQDGTEDIVKKFSATVTQPIRFIKHPVNRGLPATRNTAIEAARANWIALLDSDDVWEPSHLADLLTCAEETGGDIVHSGCILFDNETGSNLGTRAPRPQDVAEFPLSLFKANYIIQPSSVLLSREIWTRAGGFDPTFRYVEDRDMWLRCARAGGRFVYTGKVTCRYRKHTTALSTHSAPMAEAAARVFDKHLDWDQIPESLRRANCAEAWAATGRLQRADDPVSAVASLRRALKIKWRLKWWVLVMVAQVQLKNRNR